MVRGWLARSQNMRCRGHKRWLRRLYSPAGIGLLLLGCVLFHLIGHHKVRRALGHVYTPPALGIEKALVYTRFVRLVEAHPEYGRVHVSMWGSPWARMHDSVTGHAGFSADEEDELIRISRGFRRIGCMRAEKYGSYVVFMPKPNYILPTRPGVLYSLDGRNPNEVDDEFLNNKKPFMLIKDRWYTSRRLAICPYHRIAGEWQLPKSFIDHSLRDPVPVSTETTILLCQAARTGDILSVKMLLSSGADVNAKNEYGYTPLHHAAQYGHKAVVELLIANGADVNAEDKAKQMPLHRALRWGKSNVAKLLVAKGADVKAKDRNGGTPLHYAAQQGHINVVKLLLAKGANVNAKDENGRTALDRAREANHADIVELLSGDGANVNAENRHDDSSSAIRP